MKISHLALVALTGGLLQGAIAPERLDAAADMMTYWRRPSAS
jgi:hypothetical protein